MLDFVILLKFLLGSKLWAEHCTFNHSSYILVGPVLILPNKVLDHHYHHCWSTS